MNTDNYKIRELKMVSAVVYVLLLAVCSFEVHGNEHRRFVIDEQTNLTTLVAKLITQVEELKSQQPSSNVNVTMLQQEVQQLNKDLMYTQSELQTAKSTIEQITHKQGSWSTYTRWGKSTCPNDKTELVYSGYAAGSNWNDSGAATNYICLVKDPYLTGNGTFNQGAQECDYEHHAQIYSDAGYVFLNDVVSWRNCDVKVDKEHKRIVLASDKVSARSVAANKVVCLEVNSYEELMEWEQSL